VRKVEGSKEELLRSLAMTHHKEIKLITRILNDLIKNNQDLYLLFS
jgi:hypothetical protein